MRIFVASVLALAVLDASADIASAYPRYHGYQPLARPFPQWGYVPDEGCPRYDQRRHRWYPSRCTYRWPYAQF